MGGPACAIASDRCDDPELGKMGTDRIDHRRLLADEEMARAMEHQATLLLGRLGRDETHVCPSDRLADGLSVGSIVLLSLDVGLSRRLAASSAPCARAPAARATNDEMRRRLRCRQGTAVASGRMAKRSGA